MKVDARISKESLFLEAIQVNIGEFLSTNCFVWSQGSNLYFLVHVDIFSDLR